MKYVKLTAKPDTWFKEGTEVFDYDADYSEKKRITLDYWNSCVEERGICVRGIRVCEEGYEQDPPINCKVGEEREDGEYCSCDEFNVEIIDDTIAHFASGSCFSSYAITGSYLPPVGAIYAVTASYLFCPPTASPVPPVAKDAGVQEFFEKLGYTVGHDFSRKTGESWYEINDEDGLVVQIDQGVPLDDIVMDICEMHQGKPGISKSDYKISGPPCESLDLLFKRVYDWKKMGIEPDGQLTLGL